MTDLMSFCSQISLRSNVHLEENVELTISGLTGSESNETNLAVFGDAFEPQVSYLQTPNP